MQELDTPTFRLAVGQFDQAAEALHLDDNLRGRLKTPQRSLAVSVPVRMDDGRVEVVPNTAMWIVDQHPGRTLTIFTCHPIGSSAERLVVHEMLIRVTSDLSVPSGSGFTNINNNNQGGGVGAGVSTFYKVVSSQQNNFLTNVSAIGNDSSNLTKLFEKIHNFYHVWVCNQHSKNYEKK